MYTKPCLDILPGCPDVLLAMASAYPLIKARREQFDTQFTSQHKIDELNRDIRPDPWESSLAVAFARIPSKRSVATSAMTNKRISAPISAPVFGSRDAGPPSEPTQGPATPVQDTSAATSNPSREKTAPLPSHHISSAPSHVSSQPTTCPPSSPPAQIASGLPTAPPPSQSQPEGFHHPTSTLPSGNALESVYSLAQPSPSNQSFNEMRMSRSTSASLSEGRPRRVQRKPVPA